MAATTPRAAHTRPIQARRCALCLMQPQSRRATRTRAARALRRCRAPSPPATAEQKGQLAASAKRQARAARARGAAAPPGAHQAGCGHKGPGHKVYGQLEEVLADAVGMAAGVVECCGAATCVKRPDDVVPEKRAQRLRAAGRARHHPQPRADDEALQDEPCVQFRAAQLAQRRSQASSTPSASAGTSHPGALLAMNPSAAPRCMSA